MFDPKQLEEFLTESDSFLDSVSAKYPVTNVKSRQNPPQTFAVQTPEKDFIVRMCNFSGKTPRVIRVGDKFSHVVLCEMNAKGRIVQLKSGLGQDPIGVISTMYNTVMENAKRHKIDAVLFRFPINRLKGKENLVRRLIERLTVRMPRYEVFPHDMLASKRIALVMVTRKGVDLSTIKGLSISDKLFNIVSTDLGDRYIEKSTGQSLTRSEAVAKTIATQEEANLQAEQAVAQKSILSKQELLKTQSTYNSDYEAHPMNLQVQDENNVLDIVVEKSFDDLLDMKAFDKHLSRLVADHTKIALDREYEYGLDTSEISNMVSAIMDEFPANSVEALGAGAMMLSKYLDMYDAKFLAKAEKEAGGLLEPHQYQDLEYKQSFIRKHADEDKLRFIRAVIGQQYSAISEILGNAMADIDLKLPESIAHEVKEYASDTFMSINPFLSDRELMIPEEPEVTLERIKKLDDAFKYGVKLSPNTNVYRGQDFTVKAWESAKKVKAFYFKNYLSTSLAPIIFGGWGVNVTKAFTDIEQDSLSVHSNEVGVGFVIDGVDKIPVVPIGNLTWAPSECEILLPRGVVLSFDNIVEVTASTDYRHSYMVEANIMNKEQLAKLQESEIMDGDAFINEGVIKPASGFSFTSFISEQKAIESKQEKKDRKQLLANLMSLNSVPTKFKM